MLWVLSSISLFLAVVFWWLRGSYPEKIAAQRLELQRREGACHGPPTDHRRVSRLFFTDNAQYLDVLTVRHKRCSKVMWTSVAASVVFVVLALI